MTGRDVLDRQTRRAMGIAYVGVGLFVLAILGGQALGQPDAAKLIALPAFAISLFGMMYIQFFGIRCPWCQGNLSSLAMQKGGVSFNRQVRYCPFCGHDLNGELAATAEEVAG